MPRLVDHEMRRTQITDAVRRVIVTGGLAAVTFQTVAAEAGFSVRLVQYYFGTKRAFLLATHRTVIEDAGARFARRWAELGDTAGPREALRAVLIELLPLDDRRREEAVVLGAFAAAALTGEGITTEETLAAPRALTALITRQLERTGAATHELDAEIILTAAGGITQGLLQGHYTADAAIALIDHLLQRICGPDPTG